MGKVIAYIGAAVAVGAVGFAVLLFREFGSWVEDVYCEDYGCGDESETGGAQK